MKVWLDSGRLTNFGLMPSDIANALKRQNIQAAIGRIGAQPALPDQQFQLSIQTKGRLSTVEEFGAVVVRANPDGSFVRVRDIARVELAARLSESVGRLDGNARRCSASISRRGNALDSAAKIPRRRSNDSRPRSRRRRLRITYDTTIFVKESIVGVVHTCSRRSCWWSSSSSCSRQRARHAHSAVRGSGALIGTFGAMLALGYSANTVSLLALCWRSASGRRRDCRRERSRRSSKGPDAGRPRKRRDGP